ncbi:MAG: hypothetical protein EBZ55_04210, partial [Actinobacteria bacterium]|nr:hypothetical protein [Actinomycetota bacterium]
ELLLPDEVEKLTIKRGSLSYAERLEIESHVTHSFKFLMNIPWTQELANVPDIVYAHHERLDGTGYPRQLVSDEIPIQAKMMAIADVYDALVAVDRPYKLALPAERALNILEVDTESMKRNLDSTRGLVFSQAVLLALVDQGMIRDDAYRVVQEASKRSWEKGTSLRDEILADPLVKVPVAVIDSAFDVRRAIDGAQLTVNALDTIQS